MRVPPPGPREFDTFCHLSKIVYKLFRSNIDKAASNKYVHRLYETHNQRIMMSV